VPARGCRFSARHWHHHSAEHQHSATTSEPSTTTEKGASCATWVVAGGTLLVVLSLLTWLGYIHLAVFYSGNIPTYGYPTTSAI